MFMDDSCATAVLAQVSMLETATEEHWMLRVKGNDIKPAELVKTCKGNLSSLCLDKAVLPELDDVCDHFCDFICDLLDQTPRPSVTLLKDTGMLVFGASEGQAKLWGQRITAAISHCRLKLKSAVNGSKLRKSVMQIVKKLQGIQRVEEQEARLADSVKAKAATLQRQKTPTPTPPLPVCSPGAQSSAASDKVSRSATPAQESQEETLPASSSSGYKVSPTSIKYAFAALAGSPKKEHAAVLISDSSPEDSTVRLRTSKAQAAAPAMQKFKQYFDSSILCEVRLYDNGKVEAGIMKAGPRGFALAKFADEDWLSTEMPNTLLQVKNSALRRPAASMPKAKKLRNEVQEASEEDDEEPDDEEQEEEEQGHEAYDDEVDIEHGDDEEQDDEQGDDDQPEVMRKPAAAGVAQAKAQLKCVLV
jgi:hypothetical protein